MWYLLPKKFRAVATYRVSQRNCRGRAYSDTLTLPPGVWPHSHFSLEIKSGILTPCAPWPHQGTDRHVPIKLVHASWIKKPRLFRTLEELPWQSLDPQPCRSKQWTWSQSQLANFPPIRFQEWKKEWTNTLFSSGTVYTARRAVKIPCGRFPVERKSWNLNSIWWLLSTVWQMLPSN